MMMWLVLVLLAAAWVSLQGYEYLRSMSRAGRIKGGAIVIAVPKNSSKDKYEAGAGHYRAIMVAHALMK